MVPEFKMTIIKCNFLPVMGGVTMLLHSANPLTLTIYAPDGIMVADQDENGDILRRYPDQKNAYYDQIYKGTNSPEMGKLFGYVSQ